MTTTSEPDFAVQLADVPVVPVCDGITRRDLPATAALRGWVIDFAPGSRWPEIDHHTSEERYFVLDGSIIEGDMTYAAGTYVVFAEGSRHQPRTETGARLLGINVVHAG